MPYIKFNQRVKFEYPNAGDAEDPGELNYIFTRLILRYIETTGESYQSYNDCIGALEACKLELYRRLVAGYEDKKIQENGDVHETK